MEKFMSTPWQRFGQHSLLLEWQSQIWEGCLLRSLFFGLDQLDLHFTGSRLCFLSISSNPQEFGKAKPCCLLLSSLPSCLHNLNHNSSQMFNVNFLLKTTNTCNSLAPTFPPLDSHIEIMLSNNIIGMSSISHLSMNAQYMSLWRAGLNVTFSLATSTIIYDIRNPKVFYHAHD